MTSLWCFHFDPCKAPNRGLSEKQNRYATDGRRLHTSQRTGPLTDELGGCLKRMKGLDEVWLRTESKSPDPLYIVSYPGFSRDKLWVIFRSQPLTQQSFWGLQQMRRHRVAVTSHPSWLPQVPAATSCCTLSKVQQTDLAEPVMG